MFQLDIQLTLLNVTTFETTFETLSLKVTTFETFQSNTLIIAKSYNGMFQEKSFKLLKNVTFCTSSSNSNIVNELSRIISQVTFISVVLYIIQIISKQLHRNIPILLDLV